MKFTTSRRLHQQMYSWIIFVGASPSWASVVVGAAVGMYCRRRLFILRHATGFLSSLVLWADCVHTHTHTLNIYTQFAFFFFLTILWVPNFIQGYGKLLGNWLKQKLFFFLTSNLNNFRTGFYPFELTMHKDSTHQVNKTLLKLLQQLPHPRKKH